jgi:hypothetical protein
MIAQIQIGLLQTLTERNLTTKEIISIFLIVKFSIICSNIPASPAYGVYISQLIRYSRACGLLLTRKLLNQRFLLVKLKSSRRMFYGRHHDMVDRYGIHVSQMTTDMFHLSQILPGPFLIVVCPLVLCLLAIVLSVLLRYEDSNYSFGIFKLFLLTNSTFQMKRSNLCGSWCAK